METCMCSHFKADFCSHAQIEKTKYALHFVTQPDRQKLIFGF